MIARAKGNEGTCQFCSCALEPPRKTICEKCEAEWNKGAAWADEHWADTDQRG